MHTKSDGLLFCGTDVETRAALIYDIRQQWALVRDSVLLYALLYGSVTLSSAVDPHVRHWALIYCCRHYTAVLCGSVGAVIPLLYCYCRSSYTPLDPYTLL